MPREGTKTLYNHIKITSHFFIEIRYAPGGDENDVPYTRLQTFFKIEIRYAPGGDENMKC